MRRHKELVEKERLFVYLVGLDKSLLMSWGGFLEPSLQEAFSKVKREESTKQLMLGAFASTMTSENFALVF